MTTSMLLGGKQQQSESVRIAVMGGTGVGKNALLRQVRIWSNEKDPFSDEEKRMYGVVVRANIVESIRALCLKIKEYPHVVDRIAKEGHTSVTNKEEEATQATAETDTMESSQESTITSEQAYKKLASVFENNEGAEDSKEAPLPQEEVGSGRESDWIGFSPLLSEKTNRDAKLLLKYKNEMESFWKSHTVQQIWVRRRLGDAVVYGHSRFLARIQHIAGPSYQPSAKDALWANLSPRDQDDDEVQSEEFHLDGIDFELFNLGSDFMNNSVSQRWLQENQSDLDAVIFVANLADYDIMVRDDENSPINKLQTQINLFEDICKISMISSDKMLLYLNKRDEFKEKILESPIESVSPFQDYTYYGPEQQSVVNRAVSFFVNKFQEVGKLILEPSYVRVANTTDIRSTHDTMHYLLESMRSIVTTENLRRDGFM